MHSGSCSGVSPNQVQVTAPQIIVANPKRESRKAIDEGACFFLKEGTIARIPPASKSPPYPPSPKIMPKKKVKNKRNQFEMSNSL